MFECKNNHNRNITHIFGAKKKKSGIVSSIRIYWHPSLWSSAMGEVLNNIAVVDDVLLGFSFQFPLHHELQAVAGPQFEVGEGDHFAAQEVPKWRK